MNKIILVLSVAIMSAISTGCTSVRVLDATIASSKNMDIKKSLHRVDSKVRVTGVDEKTMYVLTLMDFPNMKNAMDDAIEKNSECVGLSDVVVHFEQIYIPFIIHNQKYIVEGNPIYECPTRVIEKSPSRKKKQL